MSQCRSQEYSPRGRRQCEAFNITKGASHEFWLGGQIAPQLHPKMPKLNISLSLSTMCVFVSFSHPPLLLLICPISSPKINIYPSPPPHNERQCHQRSGEVIIIMKLCTGSNSIIFLVQASVCPAPSLNGENFGKVLNSGVEEIIKNNSVIW